MAFLRSILVGKKTYLVAGLLLLATVVLLGTGKLTPAAALTLLLFAASLFPVTFRSALQQHQAETLTLLTQIAATGVAVAGKNLPAAEKAGEAAIGIGLHLVSEVPIGTLNSSGPPSANLNPSAAAPKPYDPSGGTN